MKTKAKSTKQAKNLRNVKIAVGVSAVAVVAYLLFKRDNSGTGIDPTGNGNNNPGTGGYNFNAHNVAVALYDEMKTSGYASFLNPRQADNVFAILKNVNQDQFGQVITAYGNLPYNTILGSQVNLTPWEPLPRKGLIHWMKTEFGADAIAIFRAKYPNYF